MRTMTIGKLRGLQQCTSRRAAFTCLARTAFLEEVSRPRL
jgi:hypothetical protein